MTRRCDQIPDLIHRIPVWCLLTGTLLFSFLLKLVCWHLDPVVSRDGALYIHVVQLWHDTGNFQCVVDALNYSWIPPLPFYLMKQLMVLGLSAETAGVALNMLLGTLTPLPVYGIAREITRRQDVAIGTALLAATNPAMNMLSIEVQRDMVYLFLIGLTLWLLTAGIRHQKLLCWLGAGCTCACAMLTRFETLEFLVLVPMALLILSFSRFYPWKKAAVHTGIFVLSFAGMIAALSFLMQTQNYLLSHYELYYQTKFSAFQKQLQPEMPEPEK